MSGEGASLSNAGTVFPVAEPDTGAGHVAPARSGELRLVLSTKIAWWFPVARFFAVIGACLKLWTVEASATWLARRCVKITTAVVPLSDSDGEG
jgi:hypothetical protein